MSGTVPTSRSKRQGRRVLSMGWYSVRHSPPGCHDRNDLSDDMSVLQCGFEGDAPGPVLDKPLFLVKGGVRGGRDPEKMQVTRPTRMVKNSDMYVWTEYVCTL